MALLIGDTFTEAVDTVLSSHVPDTDIVGGGWSSLDANVIAADDAVGMTAGDRGGWIDAGASDTSVSLSFNCGGVDNRFTLTARGSAARISNAKPSDSYELSIRAAPGVMYLYSLLGGLKWGIGGAISIPSNTTDDFNVRLDVLGDSPATINVYFDAGLARATTLVATFTDSRVPAETYAGFYHNSFLNNAARFDNFEVHDFSAVTGVVSSTLDDSLVVVAGSAGSAVSGTIGATLENSAAHIVAHSGSPVLGDVSVVTENTSAVISGHLGNPVSGNIQVVLSSTAAQILAEVGSQVTGDIQAATEDTTAKIGAHSGEPAAGAVSSLLDDLSAQISGHSGSAVSGQVQVTTDDSQVQITGYVTYTAEISATTESTTAQIGAHSGEAVSGAVASLLDDTGGQITAISGQASSGAIGVQLGDVSAAVFGVAGVAGPTVGAVSATTEDTAAYLHAHEGEHDYGHVFVVPAHTRVFYPGVHGH